MKRFMRIRPLLLAILAVSALLSSVPLMASATEPFYTEEWQETPAWQPPIGWYQQGNYWYYYKSDGTMATGWLTLGGSRYYLGPDGVMVTGWLLLDGKWYYFNPDGAMAKGWVFSDDYWYYLNSDGTMDPSIKDSADWMLMLVNRWNPIPEGYAPRLKSLPSGYRINERIADSLNSMLAAARSQGLSPIITSAYRTVAYQQTLFGNKVSNLMRAGLDREQAELETSREVSYPGHSEHNLGLAADIVSAGYRYLDGNQENTPEMIWLAENCAEYGFILRYPKGKEDITGTIYEPWHFRYVGVEVAREIMGNGLCLEEYLSNRSSEDRYRQWNPLDFD